MFPIRNVTFLFLSGILQVEAALTSDPSNAELLKLKSDLEEVIALTKNLIDTQGKGR